MTCGPLSLFGVGSTRAYAERVAACVGVPLSAHEERGFEDGEHKTRPLGSVRGRDVFVIHALYGDTTETVNDKLCRLLFFCGALKDAGAERVTAVTPYLCYMRKDRRTQPNDPTTTRYLAGMVESCGVDRLIALEVHNASAFDNAFRCPTRHVASAGIFAAHFAPMASGEGVVVVSPDSGGAKRAEQFRRALEAASGSAVGNALVEKFRSGGVVTGELLAGEVAGRTAIIIDDLISTGTTLARAARSLRAAGAARVFAAAAHGLFNAGASQVLMDPVFEQVVVTDTVPPFRIPPETVTSRLTILDSTATIAAAIVEEHGIAGMAVRSRG
jgi:ribose-phosphate pyrophosphokinase